MAGLYTIHWILFGRLNLIELSIHLLSALQIDHKLLEGRNNIFCNHRNYT